MFSSVVDDVVTGAPMDIYFAIFIKDAMEFFAPVLTGALSVDRPCVLFTIKFINLPITSANPAGGAQD